MRKLKLVTAIISLATSFITHAYAGDFAEFRSLGFSKDGKIFAFEQFGVQDGSGFPYAEQYFIYTGTDTFVKGSPFKVRIENEDASVKDARQLVAEQSSGIVNTYEIGSEMGRLAAFNPSTEASSSAYELKYFRYAYEPRPELPIELNLQIMDMAATGDCASFMDEMKGFRLNFKLASDASNIIIHDDQKLPKSRNCPLDYRLGGVITLEKFDAPSVHVFLILVKSFGFEGADGRWIAIPKVINN